jgi:hypothetical protein
MVMGRRMLLLKSRTQGSLQTKMLLPFPTMRQAPLERWDLTPSKPFQENEAKAADLACSHLESTLYLALNTLTQKLSLPDRTHQNF